MNPIYNESAAHEKNIMLSAIITGLTKSLNDWLKLHRLDPDSYYKGVSIFIDGEMLVEFDTPLVSTDFTCDISACFQALKAIEQDATLLPALVDKFDDCPHRDKLIQLLISRCSESVYVVVEKETMGRIVDLWVAKAATSSVAIQKTGIRGNSFAYKINDIEARQLSGY